MFLYNSDGILKVYDKNLLMWGNKTIPSFIIRDLSIRHLACGTSCCIITSKNIESKFDNIHIFGYNYNYQLSIKTLTDHGRLPLTHCDNNLNIKNIISGTNHSLIHTIEDNKNIIYGFGGNQYHQLNCSYKNDYVGLIKVFETSNKIIIKGIYCTAVKSLLYLSNGNLISFGCDKFCNRVSKLLPNSDTISMECNILCDIHDFKCNRSCNDDIFTLLMDNKNINKIVCGHYHTLIYCNNGDLYGFGKNNYGQLFFQEYSNDIIYPILLFNDQNIKDISCGKFHTMLYMNNGDLYVFGQNLYGQLGLGYNKIGPNIHYTLLMNDKNILSIDCFNNTSCIYLNNGDLYIFGDNKSRFFGLNDEKDIYIPTLLLNDKTIVQISNKRIIRNFNAQNYNLIYPYYKQYILILYKYIYIINIRYKIKIPKFIIFEIVNLLLV